MRHPLSVSGIPRRLARVSAFFAALLLLLVPLSSAVAETASGWAETDQVRVRIVSATPSVGTSTDDVRLGLQFSMQPGWKVYWRSPGDAGFPPQIDWQQSTNVAGLEMRWPAPQRFEILGYTTFGYEDEVVLPMILRVQRPGEPVRLVARLRYMTCKEICIPYDADLMLTLPEGPPASTVFTHLIDSYANRVPGVAEGTGLSIERVAVRRSRDGDVLAVTARAENGFVGPDLIVEGPEDVRFGKPETRLSDGARQVRFQLPVTALEGAPALNGADLTLTLLDGIQNAEFRANVEQGPPIRSGDDPAWWSILLIAFLGGLILNLMPCVLPVLSLKVAGVMGLGGAERAQIRRKFVATAAGIVASFLVLAAVLIGLRASGASIGWGIQFQEPLFLAAMTIILTLFAASLWGFVAIRLPSAAGSGLSRAADDRGGLSRDFLTGAFATLLATPCSAPFVGTAVGFALTGAAPQILLIFAIMGLGLATPYLAVAAYPRIAARLPRPGRWMHWLEIVLGFALIATVVWLLTVLWAQIGAATFYIAGLLIALLVVLAAGRFLGWRGVVTASAAVLVSGAVMAAPLRLAEQGPGTSFIYGDHWKTWDRQAIERHVAAGQVVFVDVTAEWCITCQVNKRLVLDQGEVRERLRREGLVAMVADWTRPDPAISDYLTSFGRYGIPFNVVYGPAAPEGIVLPELLTETAVMNALDAAAGQPAAGR